MGEENWVLAIYHDNPEFGEEEQFRTSLCLTGSGYVPRDANPFEVYRNIPEDEPEALHLVDIYVPIEPISF